jgi:transposase InsO family protein
MESFFATLKKEKLYRLRTERYSMEYVKTVIFRYIMIYYNRYRIYTANPEGLPPVVYRVQSEKQNKAA